MIRRATRLALLLGLLAAPAAAQDHVAAIGYGAGGAWFGRFNEGGGEELVLAPGWVAMGHVEGWRAGGWVGGRLGGGYTRRPLEGAGPEREIEVWLADASLLARLLPPARGRSLAPFASVGVGMIGYELGEGVPVLIPSADARYDGDSERQWAAVLGVGADFHGRFAWSDVPIGFRLELADRITRRSPFERLDGDEYGPVHNVTLTLGVFGRIW